MCISGGKRCEYSDALANVRRKVRSKMKGTYRSAVEREVTNAVRQFQKDNPEMVLAHLPEKMGFNYDPPKWEVPKSLLKQLGSSRDPIKGRSEEEAKAFYKTLHERNKEWKSNLTMQEESAVHSYTGYGFESMNAYLRNKGYSQWMKDNQHLHSHEMKEAGKTYAEAAVIPRIEALDAAMEKAPVLEEPERFYRFYRVPAGVTPEQYAQKYLQPGSGYQDKGYMSVSGDPEYVASHVTSMMEEDGPRTRKNNGYIVMEILSKAGTTLQGRESPRRGDVQSLEAETLIGRGTKMRVIDSAKRTFVYGQDRFDLEGQHLNRAAPDTFLDHSEGAKVRLLTVRMVDENLIRDTRREEKKQTGN